MKSIASPLIPSPIRGLRTGLFLIAILSSTVLASCSSSTTEKGEGGERPADWKSSFVVTAFDRLPENRGLLADHYPSSNERRIDLFQKHLEGLKGGYMGVGTDQNLTFLGWARSEYAWLMDFDPVVVAVNRIHFLFIEKSPDYATFRNYWDRKNKKSSEKLVMEAFQKDPDLSDIQLAWKVAHRGWNDVPERLKELEYMEKNFKLKTFSNSPEIYQHIRKMVQEGRIQAIPGDLNGSVTFQNIAASAKKLGVPIRVLYTSNAEEYFNFPEGYRKNILSLPVDDKSILIRTMTSGTRQFLGYPEGEKFPDTYPFHYNVQPLVAMKEWMKLPEKYRVVQMLRHTSYEEKGFSQMLQTPAEAGFGSAKGKDDGKGKGK